MTETVFTDNVVIQGSNNVTQLNVLGITSQTQPLQSWQTLSTIDLARLTANGQLQVGSLTGAPGTSESPLIEVFRDPTDAGKSRRGLQISGQVSDPLTDIISWSVHELNLLGSSGITAKQTALRVQLRNDNAGASDAGADLRAGDIEIINAGATSTGRIGSLTALQLSVTNQQAGGSGEQGYATSAYALKINISDDGGGITNRYAIHVTGAGMTHLEDTLELKAPATPPLAPALDTVRIYAKNDGHLYAKLSSNVEYQLSLALSLPQNPMFFLKGDGSWQILSSQDFPVGVIPGTAIGDGAVGVSQLADNNITTAKLVDNSVTTSKLQKSTALKQFIAAPLSGTFPQNFVVRSIDSSDIPWASPGTIGSTAANTGKFTVGTFTSSLTVNQDVNNDSFVSMDGVDIFYQKTGNNQPNFKFRRAGSTKTTPVPSGSILGAISWDGRDTTTTWGWAGQIAMIAAQQFNSGSHGSRMEFSTVAIGTTSVVTRVIIQNDGVLEAAYGAKVAATLIHTGDMLGFYNVTPVVRVPYQNFTGTDINRNDFVPATVSVAQLAKRVYAIIQDLQKLGLFGVNG